jgi:hypothetical protein
MSYAKRLSERLAVAGFIQAQAIASGTGADAGVTGATADMANGRRALFLAVAGTEDDSSWVLQLQAGTLTAETHGTDGYPTAWGGPTWADMTAGVATCEDEEMMAVEVTAEQLETQQAGARYVRAVLRQVGTATAHGSVVALVGDMREEPAVHDGDVKMTVV